MKLLFTLFAIFISGNSWANPQALSRCESELTMNGPTLNLVTYLGALLDRKLIDAAKLETLVDRLDRGESANPISPKDAETSSALLIHGQRLERLSQNPDLELKSLRRWTISRLAELGNERAQRELAREETTPAFHKMTFNTLPPGAYNTTDGTQLVRIPYSFELMTTPVSQYMWAETMYTNPSKERDGPASIQLQMREGGPMVTMQPDHPVTFVSWWSAIEFANRLSARDKLEPVYDTSGMKFRGNALRGDLDRTDGELKINLKANGYRLPTEPEIQYVLSNLNEATVQMGDHAWAAENSGFVTHEIATRAPLRLHGADFYDLYGNVEEWTETADITPWPENVPIPPVLMDNPKRFTFGGHASISHLNFRRRETFISSNTAPFNAIRLGFRLARGPR